MSAALLGWYASLRGGGIIVRLVLLGLVLALLPIALVVDILRLIVKRRAEDRVLSRTVIRCPAGHRVSLDDAWSCSHCSLAFEGHAFEECPHCAHVAGAVVCACGRTCPNPLWRPDS